MTLTRYLTLLLYNPVSLWITRRRQLAGLPSGRQGAATLSGFADMVVFPTMTTMFLAGVWHGAGLQFVVFGVLHGAYLSINHAWRIFLKPPTARNSEGPMTVWSNIWKVSLTFLAVLIAQVFFRADSMGDAVALIAGALGIHGSGLPLTVPLGDIQYFGALRGFLFGHHVFVVGLREVYNAVTRPLLEALAITFGLMAIVFFAPNVYQILGSRSPGLGKVQPMRWRWFAWQPSMPWALGMGVLLFFAAQQFDHPARFLYFQF